MDRHATEVIRSCTFHACVLRHVGALLTLDAVKTITHLIMTARLDYGMPTLYTRSIATRSWPQIYIAPFCRKRIVGVLWQ